MKIGMKTTDKIEREVEFAVENVAKGLSSGRESVILGLGILIFTFLYYATCMGAIALDYHQRFPSDMWFRFYLEDTGLRQAPQDIDNLPSDTKSFREYKKPKNS